jgi:hypothetical protein
MNLHRLLEDKAVPIAFVPEDSSSQLTPLTRRISPAASSVALLFENHTR